MEIHTNSKCLVITCGFFGDIVFASSLADKLQYSEVEYLIGFPQMQKLLQNNPNISKVHVSQIPGPFPVHYGIDLTQYERVITLKPLNYNTTPCEEYQQFAGIGNATSDYKVYTESEFDRVAYDLCRDFRETTNKPVVAVLSNWEEKTYKFTEEQYREGIDVPNLGYGGAHRDINYIIEKLEPYITMIPVGVGELNQQQTLNIPDEDTKSLLFEASLMKYCDAFIGTDGGLATIAAGVGTKTIITGDFNLQLYGWNGVLKKLENPKLGPYEYFGNPHEVVNPYATDQEVAEHIIKSLTTT